MCYIYTFEIKYLFIPLFHLLPTTPFIKKKTVTLFNSLIMVKFGARLRDELRHVGWEAHYVQYKPLKKILKKIRQSEITGEFVKANTFRKSFKVALEQDIFSVDQFFQTLINQLFDDGAKLAKLIENCLSNSDDNIDILDQTSTIGDASVDIPNKETAVGEPNGIEEQKIQKSQEEEEEEEEAEQIDHGVITPTATKINDGETVAETPSEISHPVEFETNTQTPTTDASADTDNTTSDETTLLQLPTNPQRSKSSFARYAIEQLVAFRRNVEAIVKYAAVNKEAVRKIVKKHDKQTAASDTPRLEFTMQEHVDTQTTFSQARTTAQIVRSLELASKLRTKIILKSTSFANYYDRLQSTSELISNRHDSTLVNGENTSQDTAPLLLRRSTQEFLRGDGAESHTGASVVGHSDPCIVPFCCGFECIW